MTDPKNLTPEEEAALDSIAREVATVMIDALFIKAGLLDEPTNQMGRDAYAKVRREREEEHEKKLTRRELFRSARNAAIGTVAIVALPKSTEAEPPPEPTTWAASSPAP